MRRTFEGEITLTSDGRVALDGLTLDDELRLALCLADEPAGRYRLTVEPTDDDL